MLTIPTQMEIVPPNPASMTRHGNKARLTLVLYRKLLGVKREDMGHCECL